MHPIPEVTDVELAFPTRAMTILPKWEDIPPEFRPSGWVMAGGKTTYMGTTDLSTKWLNVVNDWLFRGLLNARWTPKPGVDVGKALRALQVCLGDFLPSHEHKTSGVAYLLSQWFEDVVYERGK